MYRQPTKQKMQIAHRQSDLTTFWRYLQVNPQESRDQTVAYGRYCFVLQPSAGTGTHLCRRGGAMWPSLQRQSWTHLPSAVPPSLQTRRRDTAQAAPRSANAGTLCYPYIARGVTNQRSQRTPPLQSDPIVSDWTSIRRFQTEPYLLSGC